MKKNALGALLVALTLPIAANAGGVTPRLYCEAMLTLVLQESPVPSMEKTNARDALFAFKHFERGTLEHPESVTPSVAENLFVRSDDVKPGDIVKIHAQIEGLNEQFHAPDEGEGQKPLILGVNRTGAEPVRRVFADIIGFYGELGKGLSGLSLVEYSGYDAKFVEHFYSLLHQTLGPKRPKPGGWLYGSFAYELREATVRALLMSRGKFDTPDAEQEVHNEAAFAQMGTMKKVGWVLGNALKGGGLKSSYDLAFKPQWMVFDTLVTYDANDVPTLTLTIRLSRDRPRYQRRILKRREDEEDETGFDGVLAPVPVVAPGVRPSR